MILITKISHQTRQRGHTLSTCTSYHSLDYLGRQLLNRSFLVYVSFSLRRSFLRFPHRVYNSCAVSCTSSPFLRPPRSRPQSRPRPVPVSATALVSIPAPAPVFILCSFTGLHSRSRSRPVPAPPSVFILRSFYCLHPIPVSVPVPGFDPTPNSVCSFPCLGPDYSLGTKHWFGHWALRTDLSGARKRYPLSAEMMTLAESNYLL